MSQRRQEQRRQAFEEFVAGVTLPLLRTARLLTGDAGHAEDLVQECLFQVARRWPRVSAMEHPRAYARKVLVNLTLDRAHRLTRHRAELDERGLAEHPRREESEQARRDLAAVEVREELIRALDALAPRQRAALVLRYFEDLGEADTATILGCSVGTVKSTTSRALEKLRLLVGDRETATGGGAPGLTPPERPPDPERLPRPERKDAVP